MDLNGILQRISQLKNQLMGQTKMVSPVPEETQDDYNARMIEKMRAVKGGETPDQETVNLMRKQAANGLYPEGNKWLGTAKPDAGGEVKGVSEVVQHPVDVQRQNKIVQKVTQPKPPVQSTFVKPNNTDMGFIRPEHQQFLEGQVFPITDQEGLPREVVAGQWAGEGGRKTANPENNLFGLGPHMQFKDLPSNVKAYAKTVKKLLNQRGIDDTSNLSGDELLAIIQDERGQRYEGHNPDPSQYPKFIQSIPEYRYYKNQKKKQ